MNVLFGRSRSKHRKAAGSLKDRIGHPTPIEPININGAFIDLAVSLQNGTSSSASSQKNARIPLIPPIATAKSTGDHRESGARSINASTGSDQRYQSQPQQQTRADRADSSTQNSQYQVPEHLRGNSGNSGSHGRMEAFDDHIPIGHVNSAAGLNQGRYDPRPYSPQQSSNSIRTNFSRPGATSPPDDEGRHSTTASFSSLSSTTFSNPNTRGWPQDHSKLTLRTGASTPIASYSPTAYRPYSPASPYSPSGLYEQQQDCSRAFGRSTPSERGGSSSSNYSSSTSIGGPLSLSQPLKQLEVQRRRPERLDIQPARVLQQAETAKYFESDPVPADPVSPLLPSPRRYNNRTVQQYSPVSPEFGLTTAHPSPDLLDLNLNKEDVGTLEISFSDFSMPSPAMGTQNHLQSPTISAPQSPELQRLPTYLGKIQPVQRELDYGETPGPPPPAEKFAPAIPKRSLSRKVSRKLRTFVGVGTRPREGLPETGIVTTTTISTSTTRLLKNQKGSLRKDAISGPIPIPESQQQIDPDIEEIMARFEMERGPPPARMVEVIHDKVDDWNYSPSAASSMSSLSLHPSFKSVDAATVATESEASAGNPGLSSHRSSARSSRRNATPETPVTPADDGYTFTALPGNSHFGDRDTIKNDVTTTQRDYQRPALVSKRSEEVTVFLDTTGEINIALPSFTHEPPTPDPRKTTFARTHDSTVPELPNLTSGDKKEEGEGSSQPSQDSHGSIDSPNSTKPPRPSISTALTSVAPSPLHPSSPISPLRSPMSRKPPFPGGPKMMLRAATMSSRQNGGAPLQPKPAVSPQPIGEDEPSQLSQDVRTPTPPYSRSGSAFSFVHDDLAATRSDDSPSQTGSHSQRDQDSPPSSPRQSTSPTPFDVDRSLPRQPSLRQAKSHSNIRPKTASRAQNDRVVVSSKYHVDLPPRPSTGTPERDSLRLNTNINPSVQGSSFSAIEPNSQPPPIDQGLQPPVVKRSRSVGEGLKRAFSRRTPKAAPPTLPPPTGTSFGIPGDTATATGAGPPITQVSGPLGCGTSSETSMARWNMAIRAATVASALQSGARAAADNHPPLPPPDVVLTAQPLTAEDRQGMKHAPGTLFLRTREEGENGAGEWKEHRMKPRKGGSMQRCAFCRKGPFANMWMCLDDEGGQEAQAKVGLGGSIRERERERKGDRCRFAVCRMCCNEKVHEGSAEIF